MGMTQWWQRATGRGRAEGSPAARPAATRREDPPVTWPTERPGARPEIDPTLPVLGVDGCRAGWVGAVLDPGGHGTPQLIVAATLAEVVRQAGPVAVTAIDIPIGLPDRTRREADVQTRRFVGGAKASSVFTTPVRAALYAGSYSEANTINRDRLGAGLSQQAYGLRRSIQDVDAWLRQDLPCVVVEAHPEASFAMMTGAALISRKRSGEGVHERRDALSSVGIALPSATLQGVGRDDTVDACAVAWTAHRVKTGHSRTFPDEPEVFSDGIPAAIHV